MRHSLSCLTVVSTLLWPVSAVSESSNAWGWKGPPVEHKPQRLPGFPRSKLGRIAYVKWLVPLVEGRGLSRESAILYAAHSSRETGYGYNLWNYNFGNTKTGSNPRGPWMNLTDPRGIKARYRCFEHAEDGLEDNLRLLREGAGGRYKTAWKMLLAGDPAWYAEIGLRGYYEGPPDPEHPGRYLPIDTQNVAVVQREYARTVVMVRTYEQSTVDVSGIAPKPVHGDPWALALIVTGALFFLYVEIRASNSKHHAVLTARNIVVRS